MPRPWTLNTWPELAGSRPMLDNGSTYVEVDGDGDLCIEHEVHGFNEYAYVPLAELVKLLEANGYEVKKPPPTR